MAEKPPGQDIVARVLRWAIILFFVYAILHSVLYPAKNKPPAAAQTGAAQTTPAKEKDCDSLSNFSLVAMPFSAITAPLIHIKDGKEGTGDAAMCGQHATLRYTYDTQTGKKIYSNTSSKSTTEAVIGKGSMLHGFELGLIGMKPGATRVITMPPQLAFGALTDIHALQDGAQFKLPLSTLKNETIAAEAELISVSPALPVSPMPLSIVSRTAGNGAPAQCGDVVRADITVWKIDGTQIFTTAGSEPLLFTLGLSQVPYGIERGADGLMKGGERTLILPPAYANPLDSTAKSVLPASFVFPANETVLVEIRLLPEVKEPAPQSSNAQAAPVQPVKK